ncbi:transcriptional regulator [Enterovibrio norvegicus FF-33]|uniref:Transcriptional regulator n=1 Tax=Enterovibrio norvegicus FF-454 TaxID=1185651 RepID=A0A1E5CB52_9GAMM|nr:LysR family transcriptional regulator [Enterovibrio norvegicus]OEE62753.1 transcriptional regulator [Enterovibrio norvegicus FF-454]OEE70074.1 transcriptional regulator [Enterovibrio norvegicus FF-33]
MDTDLLRTFLEVNKTRHFGKAATNLYLTQSAVSFRIRQLEIKLGTPVFTRKRGDLRLTAAGERFVPYAENILQTWGRARQDVALTDSYQQQLTVGATSLIWELESSSDWLEHVQTVQPEWALRTESLNRQQISNALLEKLVDVVLTSEPPKLADLQQFRLTSFELVLVSSEPDQDMESIAELPLVYLDWGTRFGVEHSRIPSLQRTPVLHSHGCQPALKFLLSRGGVGFLPLSVAQYWIEAGELHLVKDSPSTASELFMVWLSSNDKNADIEELVTALSAS